MTARHWISEKKRNRFREMFPDIPARREEADKELAARLVFAITEPMLPVQEAMNRFKRRHLLAVEKGSTVWGLAAIRAFERDLMSCVSRNSLGDGALRAASDSLLLRAANIASKKAFGLELQDSPMGGWSLRKDFETFLEETLEEMDNELAARESDAAEMSPTPGI